MSDNEYTTPKSVSKRLRLSSEDTATSCRVGEGDSSTKKPNQVEDGGSSTKVQIMKCDKIIKTEKY